MEIQISADGMKNMLIQEECFENISIDRGKIKIIQIHRINEFQFIGCLTDFHLRHLLQRNNLVSSACQSRKAVAAPSHHVHPE